MHSARVIIIGENLQVQEGTFRVRLVRGGPFVPCRVWITPCERDPETGEAMTDERLHVEVDYIERQRPEFGWQLLIGEPITEAEYRYMCAASRHATAHEPDSPAANPRQPIDLSRARPPF